MKQRIFFTAVVVALCIIVNIFVGLNDLITMIGLVAAALLMRPVVLQFQMGSRVLLANHLKKEKKLHQLVKSPGFFTHLISLVASLVLAFGFFVVLKGVMLSHGALSSLMIIAIATLLLFPWLMPAEDEQLTPATASREKSGGKYDDALIDNLVDSAKGYAAFVASLVTVILILNITLALVLSAKDLGVFISTDISVVNFDQVAADKAIGYSGSNEYSRTMINAYILSDHLKLALGNMLFETFLPEAEKVNFFYAFYFATFFMNLVKLLPLSVGFVIFIGGVRRYSDQLQVLAGKGYQKVMPKIQKVFGFLRQKLPAVAGTAKGLFSKVSPQSSQEKQTEAKPDTTNQQKEKPSESV